MELNDINQPSTSRIALEEAPLHKLLINERDVFGAPAEFDENELPTAGDVLRKLFLLHNAYVKKNKKSPLMKFFA